MREFIHGVIAGAVTVAASVGFLYLMGVPWG